MLQFHSKSELLAGFLFQSSSRAASLNIDFKPLLSEGGLKLLRTTLFAESGGGMAERVHLIACD